MSETIAVALITGGLVGSSALGTQLLGWWLERGRRAHERETRLLEWRRADRLERLAPIRDYLDALSREAVKVGLTTQAARREKAASGGAHRALKAQVARLKEVLEESIHVTLRSPDLRLSELLSALLQTVEGNLRLAAQDRDPEKLDEPIRQAWDHLEELQSAL